MSSNRQASDELAQAASRGDADGARAALARGADPDYAGGSGHWAIKGERPRPLHMAFRRGDAEVARVLMAAGADLSARCGQGKSMGAWLGMGLRECAQAWLDAGGDPWADPEESLAMTAARGGSPALWSAVAARWDPLRESCAAWGEEDRQALMLEAGKWRNLGALRALGRLGWVPGALCVRRAAGDLVQAFGSKLAARDARALAKTLFSMGAPDVDRGARTAQALSSLWGAGSMDAVLSEFAQISREERSKVEARSIAAEARRARSAPGRGAPRRRL